MNENPAKKAARARRGFRGVMNGLTVVLVIGWVATCTSCKPKAEKDPAPERTSGGANVVTESQTPDSTALRSATIMPSSTNPAADTSNLPPSPAARSNAIDLTRFYNATFYEVWHGGMGGNDLSTFPYGVQTLAGVDFDARGIIQVSLAKPRFPQRVSGIMIERRCRRLHFLHAGYQGYNLPPGLSVGRYVVAYEGGETQDIPIVLGENIADWWARRGARAEPPLVVAWTGTNNASKTMGHVIHLYKATWENPQPAVPVRSVDLVAEHETVSPFLIGLTAEP
jgi:hypothetical protein